MLPGSVTRVGLLIAAVLICASPAHAQQTVNFTVGHFSPFDPNSRVSGDVINENLTFLVFDPDEFGGASFGGEWLVGLGRFLEAGAGVSYSAQTVPSFYADFVDPDGTEVDQDLHLRTTPIAFTIRVLPFGQSSAIQPYVGGGLAVINWKYRESGEFIDFNAGYVLRAIELLPKQGPTSPWRLHQNWFRDVRLLRHGPVDDSMEFSSRAPRRQPLEQAA